MKYKFVMLTSMFFLAFTYGNAQKTQTKAAESEYQKGNFPAALKILNTSEYLIFNATDEEKSDFFFLKGNVLKDLANKNIEMAKNLALAVGAYQELIGFERESGKIKYSVQAQTIIKDMKSLLVNSAAADFKASLFKESAEKSYNVYLIDKKDTLNLFYAASSSMSAKDYDSAIKYYVELKKINYSGKGIVFSATNKKTKVE